MPAGGAGIEVVTGYVSGVGSTLTAWTMATNNSNQVRSADVSSKVILLSSWAWNQVAGVLRVRSPRMHDFQQGLRMRSPVNLVAPALVGLDGMAAQQLLVPQDTLTIEQSGDGTAGHIETGSLLIYYQNLPGIAGRFIDGPTLAKNGVNIIGQEISITSGTAGGYSGQVAINNNFDNFKANTDYALVGGWTDTRVCTVRVQGVDSGNLGVGFPGEYTMRDVQEGFFTRLSDAYGMPLIPVFNAANKNAILVDVVAQQTAINVVVTLFMVEMVPGSVPGGQQK